jgi:serine/threonine protein kinase
MATTRTSVASLADVPAVSAPYLAPEQLAGSRADARSDFFAFGAILYEMVTGRRAFDEKTQALLIAAVQSVDPEPVSKVQPAAHPRSTIS